MTYRKLAGHPLHSLLSRSFARATAGVLGAATPLMALANPTGGHVVAGSATIGAAGANGTVINQSSQRAAINWQQFNVGANQYVQFLQPNSSSVVLNRVIGGNASQIFGSIRANGQVFLVNPNGILFAPGASLDVQGLVASTLDIRDADFMAGRYRFSKASGAPDATVINDGDIQAATGGYVVLAGDYARNAGSIDALAGRVVLAAGGRASLTLDGQHLISYVVDGKTLANMANVSNAGQIVATGGMVIMTADVANALTATAVNNTGIITAHSVSYHGGEIVLEAKGGGIENSGTLDASAADAGVAGGAVILHGNGRTLLHPTSVIDTQGEGARGGFVDVSGHDLNIRGNVKIGKDGMLLLDPFKLFITDGSTGGASITSGDYVGAKFIKNELNAGADVVLVASNSIVADVPLGLPPTVHPATSIVAGSGAGALTIKTGTLQLHSGASPTGSLQAFLPPHCGQGVCTPRGSGSPVYAFTPTKGTIDLTGLTIDIKGGFVADADGGDVTLGNVTAASVKVTGAKINAGTLRATGSAVTGSVNLRASASAAFSSGTIDVTGAVTADHGDVIIKAIGGGDVVGGDLTVGGAIHAGRAVSISAHYLASSSSGGGNLQLAGVTGKSVTITAISDTAQKHGGLSVSGSVKATGGDVSITDQGGSGVVVTGSISAAGDINVSASNSGGFHNVLKTGDITAGKAVSVGFQGGGASAGTTVKLGNVDSQRQMNFNVNDTSNAGSLVVKTGTLTNHKGSNSASLGSGIRITLSGTNPHFQAAAVADLAKSSTSCECGAGDINVKLVTTNGSHAQLKITGAIKSSHGNVTLGSSDSHIVGAIAVNGVSGRNVAMYGNVIGFGSVSAASHVTIVDHTTANSAAITAVPGTTISARHIDVEMSASYGGTISLANLNAQNNIGPADINVKATSFGGDVHIKVNGNINVSGKGANAGFSSAMPGQGVPLAADLNLQITGSNESGPPPFAHTIAVNGNITMTGIGGTFNKTHPACSTCGPIAFHVNGKGGAVALNASAEGPLGSVQFNGATTLKGTDAELRIGATTVKTGTLSVTGSGHVTNLTVTNSNGTGAGSSKNSAGRANVFLSGFSSSAAANITTGNVTANGKGSATVMMDGLQVIAGDIKVTATAAKGSRNGNLHNDGLGPNVPGLLGLHMESGAYNAGRAGVFIGASSGHFAGGHPTLSQSIGVGNVTVTGAGEAEVQLAGKAIATKNLTATAAKGSMHGSFFSGEAGGTGHFNIKGGEAHIDLHGSTGNVTVVGALAASGPTAGVDIKGASVKVSGGVSAIASGGTDVIDFKDGIPANVPHRHFTGPGDITGVNIGGVSSANSVNIGGTVKVKGPGLVGVMITGHKVTLGGLSASASAARKYTVLDTGDSINATDSFTVGDTAVLVFQGSAGGVTGPATVTGNVNLNAPHGNVFLGAELNVKGQFAVNASGDVGVDGLSVLPRFNEIGHAIGHNSSSSSGVPSSVQLPFKLNAAGVSMIAGGDIDLTGATLKSTGVTALKAGGDIVLSGVDINVGTFVAYAGGTLHNGGTVGSIDAGAVAFHAGKDLTLSSTDITVGSGSVPQDATTVNGNAALKAILADTAFAATLTGDPQLQAGFAAGGIPFASAAPNASFIAGGAVSLGGLTMKGGYLYLQGTSVSLGSAVTAPKGLVVQVAPATASSTTDMEGKGAKGADLNLNNVGFLDQFGDGTTLVLGASGQTGDISLGNNGVFDIGSDNLIVDTSGNVTGLGNVISTGIVNSLEALLGSLVVPPTSGEIDPDSSNNNNAAGDKKHQNQGGESEGANGTQGGTISQDTSASSACH